MAPTVSEFDDKATPTELFVDAMLSYQDGAVEDALLLAKLAGEAGEPRAQVLAGHILMRGEAGKIDDAEAVRWFKQAAAQDDIDALLALGELSVSSRGNLKPSDAAGFYKKAADLGDTQAMRALSTLSSEGLGVAADAQLADEWEARAAAEGDTEALRRRGAALMDSDPEASLAMLEQAAAQGDHRAAYAAAIMLMENVNVQPDERKAARLMKQAADAGLPEAMADYGLLVYQGAGLERDIAEAANWFRKAAEAGDKEGQFLWAFTLAKGEGVPQDYEEAYYWLLKSGGDSGVDDYDASRRELRERLETNVDAAILDRARARAEGDGGL